MKERFKKMGRAIVGGIAALGDIIWELIKGLATLITIFIIFILVMVLFPFPLFGLVALVLLLCLLIVHREKVSMIIAVLISLSLILALVHHVTNYYGEDWHWANKKWLNIHFTEHHFGLIDAKKMIYDKLTCYGAASLDTVTVEGPLIVYGKLYANELKAQNTLTAYGKMVLDDSIIKGPIYAHGNLRMNNCTVTEKMSVYGKLEAKECHLPEIEFYARKLKLKSSVVKSIYAGDKRGRKTITLIETIVEGDVLFEDGNGMVVLKKGARIKGKVTGGVVAIE